MDRGEGGVVQAVMRAMGSDGERWGAMGSDADSQMKLRSLARHSSPAVCLLPNRSRTGSWGPLL